MYQGYNHKTILQVIKKYYEATFEGADFVEVDLSKMEDDFDNFKKNNVITLAYSTDNEDVFTIEVYLDLSCRSIIRKVSSVNGIEKIETIFGFDNESNLINYLENMTFEELVNFEQTDLYIKYNYVLPA
ncbi:hypothetical protein RW115_12120 [Macrococcus capreoli]